MAVLTSHQPAPKPARRRFSPAWVWAGAVLLLIATLGAGFLVGRVAAPQRTGSQPTGSATAAIDKTLAERVHALNSGNAAKLTSIYAPDAVLEERDQVPAVVTRGSKAIADHLVGYYSMGFRLKSQSAPVQVGPYVAEAARWSGVALILVYKFDATGRIAYQWVIGKS